MSRRTCEGRVWNEAFNAARRSGCTFAESNRRADAAVRAYARSHVDGQLALDSDLPGEELEPDTTRQSSQQGANGAPIDWKGF